MKYSTPILSAVRAMHADEDKGRDPYNTALRRRAVDPLRPSATPAQVREAEQNLACYETELTLKE